MKYYKIYFSHYVNGRVKADNIEQLVSRINSYLRRQNAGEANSDRLSLKGYKEVSVEEYYKEDICVGSLDDE